MTDDIDATPDVSQVFHEARDGKVREHRWTMTPNQEAAAEKLDKVLRDPDSHSVEKKSAESRLAFTAEAERTIGNMSTVEPKSTNAIEAYRFSDDGVVYTEPDAIQAARNLDENAAFRKQGEKSQNTQKHHAPTPKPSGTPPEADRGGESKAGALLDSDTSRIQHEQQLQTPAQRAESIKK